MSEIAPLLPKSNRPPHDHPIFLRVCHSPWYALGQRLLLFMRSFIAIYMTAVLGLDLFYEIKYAKTARLFAFNASNLSYVVQVVYYWISAVWTLQHLMAPHSRMNQDGRRQNKLMSTAKAVVSIPKTGRIGSSARTAFSIFYTAAVTFPFVVTLVYWMILYPATPVPKDASLIVKILHYFVLVNKNAVNSVFALMEIMLLSSVRKQKPLATHVASILMANLLYLIWASLSHLIARKYVYKYVDPQYNGWRSLVTRDLVIMSATACVFFAQRGLHKAREKVAYKSECARQGR